MKVIIAGSRGITDYHEVIWAMQGAYFHSIDPTEIVCGEARGVDKLGKRYGNDRHLPVTSFYPEWDKFGLSAGNIRNIQMGNYADALVAIWDGSSRGTKQMIDYMNHLKKPVYVRNTSIET